MIDEYNKRLAEILNSDDVDEAFFSLSLEDRIKFIKSDVFQNISKKLLMQKQALSSMWIRAVGSCVIPTTATG